MGLGSRDRSGDVPMDAVRVRDEATDHGTSGCPAGRISGSHRVRKGRWMTHGDRAGVELQATYVVGARPQRCNADRPGVAGTGSRDRDRASRSSTCIMRRCRVGSRSAAPTSTGAISWERSAGRGSTARAPLTCISSLAPASRAGWRSLATISIGLTGRLMDPSAELVFRVPITVASVPEAATATSSPRSAATAPLSERTTARLTAPATDRRRRSARRASARAVADSSSAQRRSAARDCCAIRWGRAPRQSRRLVAWWTHTGLVLRPAAGRASADTPGFRHASSELAWSQPQHYRHAAMVACVQNAACKWQQGPS